MRSIFKKIALLLIFSLASPLNLIPASAIAGDIEVTVNTIETHDPSPYISGTVSDPDAEVTITIAGQQIMAERNGNLWFLPRNSIVPLPDGTYNVYAAAENTTTHEIGFDETTDELTINDNYSETPEVDALPTITPENQSNYQIAGVAENDGIVIFSISDGFHDPITNSVFSDYMGNFSLSFDLSSLWDGEIDIDVFAIDNANNTSETVAIKVEKDTASLATPTVNVYGYINKVNQTNVSIYGSANSDVEISFYIYDKNNNSETTSVETDENGDFSLNIDLSALEEGELELYAMARDSSGNISPNFYRTLKKDTVGPEAPQINQEPINSTNENSYLFSGTAEPNSILSYEFLDGEHNVGGIINLDSSGNFSEQLDLSSLNEGSIALNAISLDRAYNIGGDVQLIFIKDTTAPTGPQILSENVINSENVTNFRIYGNTEPNSLIYYVVSDGTTINAVIGFTEADNEGFFEKFLDLTELNEGEIVFAANSSDTASNFSDVVQRTLEKDTIGPETPFIIQNQINSANEHDYLFTGTAEPNSTLSYKFSDGEHEKSGTAQVDSSGNFSDQLDLSDLNEGDIILSFFGIDQSLNQGTNIELTLTKDTVAPALPVILCERIINLNNMDSFRIRGNAEPNSQIHYLASDGTTNTVSGVTEADGDGFFEVFIDLSQLVQGDISLALNSRDSAFNFSELASTTLEKDTIAPSTPHIYCDHTVDPNNVNRFRIYGYGEPNSQVNYSVKDRTETNTVAGIVETDTNGFFEIFLDLSALTDGDVALFVETRDSSFNLSDTTVETLAKATLAQTVNIDGGTANNNEQTAIIRSSDENDPIDTGNTLPLAGLSNLMIILLTSLILALSRKVKALLQTATRI